jgi:tetratricopeptide (TPR) repeat protein
VAFLYFHLGDDDDIPFEFGRLLYRMDYYPEALQYFSRSIELYGENPHTRFNMSLCYFYLHQRDEALTCVAKTLALNPNHQGAKGLRIEIQAWTR